MTAKKTQTSIASSHLNGLFLYAESTVPTNAYHETIHYYYINNQECLLQQGQVCVWGVSTSTNAFTPSTLSTFNFLPASSMDSADIHTKQGPAATPEEAAQAGTYTASVQQPSHRGSPPAKSHYSCRCQLNLISIRVQTETCQQNSSPR